MRTFLAGLLAVSLLPAATTPAMAREVAGVTLPETSSAAGKTRQQYVQTAINAFTEVSNTLVTQEKLKGVRSQQERQVKALQQAVDLSLERYDQGISIYYEVLEGQQQLFPAELDLARTTRDQLVAIVLLYRALGGGWNLDDPRWVPPSPAAAVPPTADSARAPDSARPQTLNRSER